MNLVHSPTFRLNSFLLAGFLVLSVLLWMDMPESYPVHLGIDGSPSRWAEGPGMWILLVAVGALSFGKLHLFQRFLINDPDSTLINVPYKKLFLQLPRERKIPVLRRTNRTLGLINTGLILLHIALLFLVYHTAHNPDSPATAAANHSLLILLGLVILVPFAELFALRRMIRRKLVEEGLLDPPTARAESVKGPAGRV